MLSNYHPNADMVPVAMQHSPLQVLRARGVASIEYEQGTERSCRRDRH